MPKYDLLPCECGHSPEEHGDPAYPGSSACAAEGCQCIHYEPEEERENITAEQVCQRLEDYAQAFDGPSQFTGSPTELVRAAGDFISAQAAEIERLTKRKSYLTGRLLDEEKLVEVILAFAERLEAQLAAVKAERDAMRKTLKPFADAAIDYAETRRANES